jgi:RNA polymerase sigma-19 factor, ECF subfamily
MDSPATSPRMRDLYSDHRAWLHGWLSRRLRCAWDAADLTQDTFARIWARRDLTGIREPRAFLTTVAHGLLVNFRRRREIEKAYLATAAQLSVDVATSQNRREGRRSADDARGVDA